ncbi:Sporulation initiation inhibitor protein soj [Achromobacter xylosoxidans]|uniref:ParA family protein n=1 Tax=Achromobacter TaxID=222 RepID=UPI0006C676EA|nr:MULTISPECIES: ParA family protein [Achromobacter]CAB3919739.1 Chromosome-partitioning ATPase Soj [Achromobacter insuavis]CUJ33126.1 Sporulation initiation inhibitor protein soj [Achromobacter xylosoxidans]CUJ40011.1 Sporulation initiation inhibitor protein soj [Achromobacter sp. 2789STDY5608621]
MFIYTFINRKGGVGKTATAFNLARYTQEQGLRTGVIDLDTQGSLSRALTNEFDIQHDYVGGAMELLKSGGTAKPSRTTANGIDVWHGHEQLEAIDSDSKVEDLAYSSKMKEKLRELPYDVLIIDTPPAIGLRHVAPLYWSDRVVIPVEPDTEAVIGLQNVYKTLESVRFENPGLVTMIAINKFKASSKSHKTICAVVQQSYGDEVIAVLNDRVAVADCRQEDVPVPVWRYRRANKATKDQWLGFVRAVVQ